MIITSFSQKGYHEYGKRFIEGFLKHWKDQTLTVYYEHGIPSAAPKDDRIIYKDLYSFDDFKQIEAVLNNSDPIYSGKHINPQNPQQQVYNFRYDANRFYRKVFAICDACHSQNGIVAWVDADVVFKADIPPNFLQGIFAVKEGEPEFYMAVLERKWLYSENGFVGFNTNHPANNFFMPLWYNTYAEGAFKYLGEFHDCYSMDFIRTAMAIPYKNLNPNEQSNHPFQESILGEYMEHLKGPERKAQGGLLDKDPGVEKPETQRPKVLS